MTRTTTALKKNNEDVASVTSYVAETIVSKRDVATCYRRAPRSSAATFGRSKAPTLLIHPSLVATYLRAFTSPSSLPTHGPDAITPFYSIVRWDGSEVMRIERVGH